MNMVAKVEIYSSESVSPVEVDDMVVSVNRVENSTVELVIPSPCNTGYVVATLELDQVVKAALWSK